MTAPAPRHVDTAGYGRALLNILEDSEAEREELERTKRAALNILEDLATEKSRLEETQEALRASLHEKEVLLREVHHRVKNNLQLIASLLNLQGRYLHDQQSRALMEESQGRIYSIALVHETLYQSGELSRISLGNYLGTLVRQLLDSWMGVSGRIELRVDISPIEVPIDVAIPCGLIVNELVTNAFKHAFPGERRGTVRVSAHPGAPGQVVVVIADDGVGLPAAVQAARSGRLGLQLVTTLTRQLRGALEYGAGPGTEVTLTLPHTPAPPAGAEP